MDLSKVNLSQISGKLSSCLIAEYVNWKGILLATSPVPSLACAKKWKLRDREILCLSQQVSGTGRVRIGSLSSANILEHLGYVPHAVHRHWGDSSQYGRRGLFSLVPSHLLITVLKWNVKTGKTGRIFEALFSPAGGN